mgnify:CR=1 FL=1
MIKYIIPFIAILIICESFTFQSKDDRLEETKLLSKADTNDNMTIILGDRLFRFDENDSSMAFRIGNRGMNILESFEGTKVNFEKYEASSENDHGPHYGWDQDRHEHGSFMRARHFRGHWAGIEIGFNNYNHVNSTALPNQIDYMSVEGSSSNCFNLNFSQLNIRSEEHTSEQH